MTATPTQSELDVAGPPSRIWRIVAISVIASSAVFWVWAFSPLARKDNPDRLPDRTYPRAAEAICAQAKAAIDELPRAFTATSPQDRAVVVERSNEILAAMIDDLHVGTPDDTRVQLWLEDYEVFLGNRRDHAAALAAGEDRQFEVAATLNKTPIDERIDGFARVNDMESCTVPLDV